MKLAEATVVITGGARRVGRHIATVLAQHGANIVLNYQTSAEEAQQATAELSSWGVTAIAVKADVSTKQGVESIRDTAISEFGSVEVLINNAAIYAPTPLENLTESDVDHNIDVNLKGPFLGCWLFGLHMRKHGHGKILNISDWAVDRPYVNYAPYFVAKGGIVTLTKVFAKELAPHVTVNAIAPGPILMPDDFSQKTIDAVARATPLQRIGDPEDIAQTVLFLLQGTDFVTGAVIPVDGGRTVS
jgi:NAD(P)-dependent dehydrogenase (short-subunit alcohol dehydrogenase family)